MLAAIPRELPWLRLYRRMVGTAEVRGRMVSFGIKGQFDLYGFTDKGEHVEVELKAAGGKCSDEQFAWLMSLQDGWAICTVLHARRDESLDATIKRWLYELRALCGR